MTSHESGRTTKQARLEDSRENTSVIATEEGAPSRELPSAPKATETGAAIGLITATAADRPADAFDPRAIWRQVQSEFAMQQQPGSFDSWIQDTWVIGYEDGEFIIGLADAFKYDWLAKKLRTQIKRKLSLIMKRSSVDVNFRIQPRPVADAPNATPAPLYDQAVAAEEAPIAAAARVEMAPARDELPPVGSQINPHFTFSTLVVGTHNRLAHAAAMAVIDQPGKYNPLFVHGGVGVGKTHLLHAMANQLAEKGLRVLYCSSEQFTNDLVAAIRGQNTDSFRAKYRQVDVLLLDDIQFLAGKPSTQEELFHTFNHLHAAGKQVIISSDRSPKTLSTLEERLRSRFEGGIQTDIAVPDFETRVSILQAKCRQQQLSVPHDVLMLIADRVESSIRELEGALNNLWMQARLRGGAPTLGLAESILSNLAPRRTPCAPVRLIQLVAEYFGLTAADLTGRRRTANIAHARHIAMFLLREDSGLSLPAIGDHLGNRDHTTIHHGVDKVSADIEQDEVLRRDLTALRERLYAPY